MGVVLLPTRGGCDWLGIRRARDSEIYVSNLDRLNLLGDAVTGISRRHVQVNVQPEQYPIVGKHLLGAIETVLGDTATPEILDAWAAAYNQLAQIMIDREQAMYDGTARVGASA